MNTKEIIYEASKSQTKITFEFILDILMIQDDQVYTKNEVISLIKRCQRMAFRSIEKNKP